MLGWRRETYGSLLRNANYRRWFLSSLGSSLGDWIGLFALQVLIISVAEPGTRLALFGLGGLMTARLLPSVLFGPISGVVADRYDRRLLMVWCDLGRAGLFLGLAFTRNIVLLLLLVFIVESLSMLYLTTKTAVLPAIVEDAQLTEANQIALAVTFGPLPFGAAAAALLSWLAGVMAALDIAELDPTAVALLFNAATFLVAGLIIARMRLPSEGHRVEEQTSQGALESLRQGFRFVRERPLLRAVNGGVLGAFLGAGVIITLGPEYVRAELGRPAEDWYGLIAAVGFGLLVGFAFSPGVVRWLGNARALAASLTVVALLAIAPSLVGEYRAVQVIGFLLGGLAAVAGITGFTLLQRVPDEIRARALALFFTGTRVALFASLALAPFLAGWIGVRDVGVGDRDITVSGIRITMFLGGLAALISALAAARGMLRRGHADETSG